MITVQQLKDMHNKLEHFGNCMDALRHACALHSAMFYFQGFPTKNMYPEEKAVVQEALIQFHASRCRAVVHEFEGILAVSEQRLMMKDIDDTIAESKQEHA